MGQTGTITNTSNLTYTPDISILIESPMFYNHAVIQSVFMQNYLDYCYADSVLVGYTFILEEHFLDNGDGWSSAQECYFKDRHQFPNNYLRREDIKEPHEDPTFKGYAVWLKNLLNKEQ